MYGSISILGQIKVTSGWADDPLKIHDGCWCKGCMDSRGISPPPHWNDIGRLEERVGQVKNNYVTISNGA